MALQTNIFFAHALVDPGAPNLPETPAYTEDDVPWVNTLPMTQYLDGWWRAAVTIIILPDQLGKRLSNKIYQSYHIETRGKQHLVRESKIKIKDVQQKI